ncbi:MAG: OadG family protein [Fibrobacter sp.]|nr:OadG family protein [Fibrobacter sp.]
MIADSLILMLLGIGIVFSFLILLIFCVRLMGYVIQKHFPTPVVVPTTKATRSAAGTDDGAIVAAISTAISMFRKERS